ncbi:TraB/GumN family protein [Janthinobacterium fluminis]|uniref:TraB/GumN family protein n=1 Tax=Janthinobacterium fluminis TaxID=2987524 RepID=A0ABT5JYG2_9BURK|nr:TraB/GumN family protein [Janthinobacterium fluminis]MDC8757779.1 TraB/GumN family protein [Janthinobacterium fluminis]
MFCLFFLAAPPAARAEAPAQAAAPAGAPNRGALFKVEGGGHTLYLFGTIHVGAADFYPLEPRVTAALERASVLALEVDPNGDPAAAAQALRRHGLYAAGAGPAAADIAPAFRPRLAKLLRQYGIAPESVAPMKPWLLASVLAVSEFAAQGYQAGLAVDSYLSRQARERRIPVLELESMAGQMALFDRMTAAEQGRFLEDGIAAIEDQEQAVQARQIAQAWRTADTAAFAALARQAAADTSFAGQFVQKVLLDGRNPALADGIAALLARERDSMAAIGVLHLVGADSVPALLKRRGLRVEQVY